MTDAAPLPRKQPTQQRRRHSAKSRVKEKYEEQDDLIATNIMFDRRVVRGNTYASNTQKNHPIQNPPVPTKTPPHRKPLARRPSPGTPEPAEGRRHTPIQTEAYLEELTDVVPESEANTQTDAFQDRPPSPLYIPAKLGDDAETQIEPGELFDFDVEVLPLVEQLVGRCLEQAVMEVLEEDELAALAAHQRHFQQLRAAELAAVQRAEAAEKRKFEEKERRLAQAHQRAAAERSVREKVAAAAFSRAYLKGVMNSVVGRLYDSGYFYDPVEKEVRDVVLPWLRDQTLAAVQTMDTARNTLDAIVGSALQLAQEKRSAAAAAWVQREADMAAEGAKVARAKKDAAEKEDKMIQQKATLILNKLQDSELLLPEVLAEMRQVLELEAIEKLRMEKQRNAPPKPRPAEVDEDEDGEGKTAHEDDEETEEPAVEIEDRVVLFSLLKSGAVTRDAIAEIQGGVSCDVRGHVQVME